MFAGPRHGKDSTICQASASVKLAPTMSHDFLNSSACRELSGRSSAQAVSATSVANARPRAAAAPCL
eukprot:6705596-Pyramimonas_sp.AAC.1